MTNFIDRFEAELVATAPRPLRTHERLRRWVAGHAVASLVIAATATAATAGAAVTTLTGTPSAPLHDRFTFSTTARSASNGRYRIEMSASLGVGSPGWCSRVTILSKGMSGAGFGCSGAVTDAHHIASGGFEGLGKTWLVHLIVDDRVGGLRLGNGHVVLARTDRSLPRGWKAIVVLSGQDGAGRFNNRSASKWRLLDAHGRVLNSFDEDQRAAQAGDAKSSQPTRVVPGELPPDASCQITRTDSRPWPRPVVRSISLQGPPKAAPVLAGHPFLACAAVQIGDQGHLMTAMQATLLVDAREPGVRPDALPGLVGPDDGRVAGAEAAPGPMLRPFQSPGATAQRRGNAWLVVSGGTPLQQRELIARLTTRVNLG